MMTVNCCQCGIGMAPNERNTCNLCIARSVDICSDIRKLIQLYYCRFCDRYLQPPNTWIACEPESRELLAMCLKRVVVKDVAVKDAKFLFSEPHSFELKIELTVGKMVGETREVVQQCEITCKLVKQMCVDCHRLEAKDYWKSSVQVRQHVPHKKTFLYLEQIILKRNYHSTCTMIKSEKDGLDFFFANKQEALKFIGNIAGYVPHKVEKSKELVTHDTHCNTYQYKHTFYLEIVPVCKHDIVCLSKKQARGFGLVNQLVICEKVTNILHLIDPLTLRRIEVNATKYYCSPFFTVASLKNYTDFCVIDILEERNKNKNNKNNKNEQILPKEATLMRSSVDFTNQETTVNTKTHLNNIKVGDNVSCLDLAHSVINNSDFDQINLNSLPDVLIVKKLYKADQELLDTAPDITGSARNWKLKRIDDFEHDQLDMEEFMCELEQDAELRKNVNIYKDKNGLNSKNNLISLEEMLEDLEI